MAAIVRARYKLEVRQLYLSGTTTMLFLIYLSWQFYHSLKISHAGVP